MVSDCSRQEHSIGAIRIATSLSHREGIWCNSSHDGPQATAERKHTHHYASPGKGQDSDGMRKKSKSGLGPGLAGLRKGAANGRRRRDVDECWWLVKQVVPLLRMLSSCTGQAEGVGEGGASSAYPAQHRVSSVRSQTGDRESEREIGAECVRCGMARYERRYEALGAVGS